MTGDELRQLRQEAGLSQEQLARYLGVTDRAVGHYETGIRQPSPQIVGKMARVLVTYQRALAQARRELADLVTV